MVNKKIFLYIFFIILLTFLHKFSFAVNNEFICAPDSEEQAKARPEISALGLIPPPRAGALNSFEGIWEDQNDTKILLYYKAGIVQHSEDSGTLLHLAAERNWKKLLDSSLQCGMEVNHKNKYGLTPLHISVREGNRDMVETLLTQGANIHAIEVTDKTVLHFAAKRGLEQTVDLLVEEQANIHAKDKDGNLPLHLALQEGYINIAEKFINMGVDVNLPGKIIFEMRTFGGELESFEVKEPPLNTAARQGYSDIVELLIKEGANINSSSKFYGNSSGEKSALIGALMGGLAIHGNMLVAKEIAENLIKAGAELERAFDYKLKAKSIKDNLKGVTPLHAALMEGQPEIALKIMERVSDINKTVYREQNFYDDGHLLFQQELSGLSPLSFSIINAVTYEVLGTNLAEYYKKFFNKALKKSADMNIKFDWGIETEDRNLMFKNITPLNFALYMFWEVQAGAYGDPEENEKISYAQDTAKYLAEQLINHGSDLNVKSKMEIKSVTEHSSLENAAPIAWAIMFAPDLELIKHMVDKGGFFESGMNYTQGIGDEKTIYQDIKFFLLALYEEKYEITRFFIDQKSEIASSMTIKYQGRQIENYTPLHDASFSGSSIDLVEFLIENGRQVKPLARQTFESMAQGKPVRYWTPKDLAQMRLNKEIVKILRKLEAEN